LQLRGVLRCVISAGHRGQALGQLDADGAGQARGCAGRALERKSGACGTAALTANSLAQGHLFHIDFEYILGNDPKPFAPPMKLCEQMVVAMGGRTSKVRLTKFYA
jgi:hypothetical protein